MLAGNPLSQNPSPRKRGPSIRDEARSNATATISPVQPHPHRHPEARARSASLEGRTSPPRVLRGSGFADPHQDGGLVPVSGQRLRSEQVRFPPSSFGLTGGWVEQRHSHMLDEIAPKRSRTAVTLSRNIFL